MPAARYWRLVGVETFGGQALELSEIQLYALGARVDASITMTCSHTPISGSLANLQDASTASVCRFAAQAVRSPGFAFLWDFGGTSPDVSQFRLGSSALKAEHIALAELHYSSNGYDWTPLRMAAGMLTWPGANTMAAVDPLGDLEHEKVTYLAHCDGANNSTTLLDSSAAGLAMTCYLDAKLSTAQSKWGGASLGILTAGSFTSVPANAGFDFGAGDFTFECWVYPTSLASFAHVMGQWQGGATSSWHIGIGPGTAVVVEVTNTGDYVPSYSVGSATGVITLNAWNLISCDRVGSTIRAYANGVEVFSFAAPASLTASTNLFTVGRNAAGQQLTGYVDDIRVTKGVGRYGGGFSLPGAAFAGPSGVRDPRLVRARATATAQAYAAYNNPGSVGAKPTGLQTSYRDMEFGGRCAVVGVTKIKGSPNTPFRCRVRLLRDRDAYLVRETWSDATTGAFIFAGLSEVYAYTAYAQDHTGNYRAVMTDRITAEVPA